MLFYEKKTPHIFTDRGQIEIELNVRYLYANQVLSSRTEKADDSVYLILKKIIWKKTKKTKLLWTVSDSNCNFTLQK